MIVGQDKLLKKIDNLTLDSLPHSIILLGDIGSGKSMICDYIANKFNVQLLDITNNLNQEYIDELMLKPEPYIYKIKAKDISVKDENTILKFIEEPTKNSYIIICCDSKNQLIDTILNRCQIWQLDKYSKEVLKDFTSNEFALNIVKTPGQALKFNSMNLDYVLDLANKIFDKINIASYPNTLTLVEKMSFKDEQDKIDFDLFVDLLIYTVRTKINSDISDDILKKLLVQYELTSELYNSLGIAHINKKHLFENYLLKMKGVVC